MWAGARIENIKDFLNYCSMFLQENVTSIDLERDEVTICEFRKGQSFTPWSEEEKDISTEMNYYCKLLCVWSSVNVITVTIYK